MNSTLLAGQQLAVALQRRDARALEQREDALRAHLDDARLALLHRGDVHRRARDLDAVRRELVLRAVIELGGFEQRLRRNAARIQAGAAERGRAVAVLPLVDAGDGELVLRRRGWPPDSPPGRRR